MTLKTLMKILGILISKIDHYSLKAGCSNYFSLMFMKLYLMFFFSRCIYKLTKFSFLNENAMLAIGEVNNNDLHFHFGDGKYLAFDIK